MSDIVQNVSLLYQPTLLRNILGIVAVSLVMTWVEIAVLRLLLLPQINAAIINRAREEGARSINRRNNNLTDIEETDPFFAAFKPQAEEALNQSQTKINASIAALEIDEARLINTSNNFVTFITFVPWLILCFIAFVLYSRLKKDAVTMSDLVKQGKIEIFGFQTRATILSTVVGIAIFSFLQYSFYQMSLKWNMPEIDDLLYLSSKNIAKSVCTTTN